MLAVQKEQPMETPTEPRYEEKMQMKLLERGKETIKIWLHILII